MTTNKGKSEKDIAAYYQTHKEDEGEWEDEPTRVEKPAKVGNVYSIRFTAQELDTLRAVANSEGVRISDLIRDALAQYLATKSRRGPEYLLTTVPDRSRYVWFRSSNLTRTATNRPKRLLRYGAPNVETVAV